MERVKVVAQIREAKGDAKCACRPDDLVQCLMHFDLDRYILTQAIARGEGGE